MWNTLDDSLEIKWDKITYLVNKKLASFKAGQEKKTKDEVEQMWGSGAYGMWNTEPYRILQYWVNLGKHSKEVGMKIAELGQTFRRPSG